MAMTKKEKAEFDAAIYRAELFGALRWTSEVKEDVHPPGFSQYREFSTGWHYNKHRLIVEKEWSSMVAHGSGSEPAGKYASARQNGKRLFSSKKLALMAMRHAVEKEAAQKLLRIDKMIEEFEKSVSE